MADQVKLTITLEASLAARLSAAAAERGWASESLAADCVAQALEVAIRHRVLIERMEQVDAAILDMAQAVGELGAPSTGIDLSQICRYRKGTGGPDLA
ncbi:hypothetical protein ABID82_006691 [Methylobacterium sp. PvP062]|jgi:hypothetical protein|uniref:CopG family transcriptional regulator n=2 Tax=Methylobacterium TaxID=407 RepID=A0ABQ4SPY2_9HYPH|nr:MULTISPECIES: hypothetical protein [Methylobacterium]KOX59949.1 hypothetical protein ADL19_03705 [Streptomyces purpurogeneiscleroticus]GAN50996.1 hypothetical protein ME121_5057 [Methylobacterium sp. ME121]MBN6822407.1 hypothetical protein [Methylobacterium organophilum]MBP2498934.1 hypothetical protein [Methylobacterium sp. PvP105]MBP2506305.1 hypothetical protein [Methylobacterium sp. PvP109]